MAAYSPDQPALRPQATVTGFPWCLASTWVWWHSVRLSSLWAPLRSATLTLLSEVRVDWWGNFVLQVGRRQSLLDDFWVVVSWVSICACICVYSLCKLDEWIAIWVCSFCSYGCMKAVLSLQLPWSSFLFFFFLSFPSLHPHCLFMQIWVEMGDGTSPFPWERELGNGSQYNRKCFSTLPADKYLQGFLISECCCRQ